MKYKNYEENYNLNDLSNQTFPIIQNKLNTFLHKINYKIILFVFLLALNDIIMILFISSNKNNYKHTRNNNSINKEDKVKNNLNKEDKVYNNYVYINPSKNLQKQFLKEMERPYFKEINLKRTFEKRLPFKKKINCKPHFSTKELFAFLSFLTNETIYFETGSGCSSFIAKQYSKKSYAVEGCKYWYEQGIKNGLKDNLIFHDLKPDNPTWSYPGKKSTIKDWKKYFQSYKKKYNADIILIDGRFKIATALDIFDKIRNDTLVFIHEYQDRPSYFIIENYYQYVYHWDTLVAFIKKKDISHIPLEIQKKYWDQFL